MAQTISRIHCGGFFAALLTDDGGSFCTGVEFELCLLLGQVLTVGSPAGPDISNGNLLAHGSPSHEIVEQPSPIQLPSQELRFCQISCSTYSVVSARLTQAVYEECSGCNLY